MAPSGFGQSRRSCWSSSPANRNIGARGCKLEANELNAQKLAYAVVEPTFTVDEAHQLVGRYGSSVRKIIDAIDDLSGVPDFKVPTGIRVGAAVAPGGVPVCVPRTDGETPSPAPAGSSAEAQM